MAEDLFGSNLEQRFDEFAPLAARMRPRKLDDLIGQDHLIGKGRPLSALIENDALTSLVLWGPPGTGKTSLANVIARSTQSRFVELSATSASVVDVRKTIAESKQILGSTGRKTILFIDEIHRFNKSQQDALLPAVENRWIIMIGATTENPFFEINSPLLSRSSLFRLERLSQDDIKQIVMRALSDGERGLGSSGITLAAGSLEHIVETSGGDARSSLNALEICVASATAMGVQEVSLELAQNALQQRRVRYDKKGDTHYDVISAFIKSMRGTDPDAALFWLARMLEAGEDPKFIARRMVVFASEDVGNADPMALVVAVAAFQALEFVGLPEAKLNLSQAVTYLASAPKSNASTIAIGRAERDLAAADIEVPGHLRDGHQPAAKSGKSAKYRYPHDFPGAWVAQQYRPSGIEGHVYYEPVDRGAEIGIAERLDELRKLR